jgi:nitrite reductase (NO-forming)
LRLAVLCGLALAVAVVGARTAFAATVQVELTAVHKTVKVAPGVRMRAWTFNGTVPGPVVRATVGDTVEVTLHNAEPAGHGMAHSVDFHAAQVAPDTAFADVPPGGTRTFSFVARQPGVFLYHCGTSPVLQHIGMGMYGAILVEPAAAREPANETVLVQSELYGEVRDGRLRPTYQAMLHDDPAFVVFNGKAFRYKRHPIAVEVGQPQRIYLVDAGPSLESDFHVVGEVFDTVSADGNPLNALYGVSTYGVPAGGGAVFELSFDEPGTYPFLTHALRWAETGALGMFAAR